MSIIGAMKFGIFIFLLTQGFPVMAGMSVTLTSKFPYAVRERRFNFMCTLTDADHLADDVCFQRHTQTTRWCFNQTLTSCSRSSKFESGYTITCGEGTNKPWSYRKQYKLDINTPNKEDENDWWCEVKRSGVKSKIFHLTMSQFLLRLKWGYSEAEVGKVYKLQCTLANFIGEDVICFERTDLNHWCFHQEKKKCTRLMPFTHSYLHECGRGTMVLASYKEYLLTIRDPVPDDAQTYWCIMHNATLKSNSLKLTVKGFNLTLTGSAPYANLGKRFTLICTATNAIDNLVQVCFYAISREESWCLYQKYDKCSPVTVNKQDRYHSECGEGTDLNFSYMKIYKLIIREILAEDGGKWRCRIKDNVIKSHELALAVIDFTISITGSSPKAVIDEQFVFTCTTADFHKEDMICIGRQDKQRWCMYQHKDKCTILGDYHNYQPGCGSGTDDLSSSKKQYTLTIKRASEADSSLWNCELDRKDVSSESISLKVQVYSIALTTLPEHAKRGKTFMFTCTLTNFNTDDVICFYHQKLRYWCLHQLHGKCKRFGIDGRNYKRSCGLETHIDQKLYTLEIERLSQEDNGHWWCQLTYMGTQSYFYQLEIEVLSLSLTGSSSYAIKGQEFTLTCTVKNAENMFDLVQFYRDSSATAFGSLNQSFGQCVPLKGEPRVGYDILCGEMTDDNKAPTKTYILKIHKASEPDKGKWRCEVEIDNGRSSDFPLEVIGSKKAEHFAHVSTGIAAIIVSSVVGGGLIASLGVVFCLKRKQDAKYAESYMYTKGDYSTSYTKHG